MCHERKERKRNFSDCIFESCILDSGRGLVRPLFRSVYLSYRYCLRTLGNVTFFVLADGSCFGGHRRGREDGVFGLGGWVGLGGGGAGGGLGSTPSPRFTLFTSLPHRNTILPEKMKLKLESSHKPLLQTHTPFSSLPIGTFLFWGAW